MNDSADQVRWVRAAMERLEIAELYAKYAMALDDQDLELMAACFTEDVEFVPGNPDAPSRTGIKANQDRLVQRHREANFRERHITTHPVIRTLEESRAEASAEAAIYVSRDGAPPKLKVIGRYDDILERHQGRWKFARRLFVRDV
ncbi:MAG: SgcJ/EcaC family oxidoreductase [Rhodospirillales bacterium]|nr:SgcJ/EcaC family oxidoreductase [Rhodospirillales bacterium]MDP6805198.1 SgcJ/EcaC family oxidoreductase [Rhodospirillales bacterium]